MNTIYRLPKQVFLTNKRRLDGWIGYQDKGEIFLVKPLCFEWDLPYIENLLRKLNAKILSEWNINFAAKA